MFLTEEALFDEIVKSCNLGLDDKKVKRHPLAFLVEAADSICYSTMDMEDGYNIQWYSFDDMVDAISFFIVQGAKEKGRLEILAEFSKDPGNSEQFSIEKFLGFKREWKDGTKKDKRRLIVDFRVALINYLTKFTIEQFIDNLEGIDTGKYSSELLKEDPYGVFDALSKFSLHKIISRRDIQELELTGNSVINGLLNILMSYTFSEDRKFRSKIKAVISKSRVEATLHENMHKGNTFMKFEEKDFWDFDVETLDNYSKLRLIVDFVASMTDKYSVELYQKFAGMSM